MTIREALENDSIAHEKNDVRQCRIYNGLNEEPRYRLDPGERVAFRKMKDDPRVPDDAPRYFTHRALQYGDYNGTTTVERSNVRVILDEYGDVDGVHEIYGSYGFTAVAVRLDVADDWLIEDLQALSDHPLLDSDELAELEQEIEQKMLDAWAIADFWAEVNGRFDDAPELWKGGKCLLDEFSEASKRDLFFKCQERAGEYWRAEDPYSMYVDTDRMAQTVKLSDLTS